jgi:hypothetical protein
MLLTCTPRRGDYARARSHNFAWRNMLARVATSDNANMQQQQQFDQYMGFMADMDSGLRHVSAAHVVILLHAIHPSRA